MNCASRLYRVSGIVFSQRRRHASLCVLTNMVLVSACGGGSGSAVSDPGSSTDGRLADVLETVRTAHDVPALAAVLMQDGLIIEMDAVGTRITGASEQVTESDKWHIGSITKSITSTLAAILIERGLLDWNTNIADILSTDIPGMRSEYRNVTVEQLMAHTGGLPVDITRSSAFQAGDVNDDSRLSMHDRRLIWSSDLLQLTPDAAQGSHLYSNANYIVLGAMVEKITGELWENLVMRELFVPLGMTNSGFSAPGSAGSRSQPWGHANVGGVWQAVDPGDRDADSARSLGPAGTIHTTLTDFSAYMAAHLSGARGNDGLLSATTFTRLHTPQPGTNYAGGWVINSNGWAGNPSFWHNGSNGRWFAHTVIAPNRNGAVLVVTNSGSRGAVEDMINVMIQRFEAIP